MINIVTNTAAEIKAMSILLERNQRLYRLSDILLQNAYHAEKEGDFQSVIVLTNEIRANIQVMDITNQLN